MSRDEHFSIATLSKVGRIGLFARESLDNTIKKKTDRFPEILRLLLKITINSRKGLMPKENLFWNFLKPFSASSGTNKEFWKQARQTLSKGFLISPCGSFASIHRLQLPKVRQRPKIRSIKECILLVFSVLCSVITIYLYYQQIATVVQPDDWLETMAL